MALEKSREFSSKDNSKPNSNDNFKSKVKRDKSFQTKVVVRRLPPSMVEEQFIEQISPLPDHDYMHFVRADMRLGPNAFSRAYINFLNPEDIFIFKEKFDDYVFLDTKGNEYPAIVEFAPFQKIPKKRSKKRDAKSGTIENDPDYIKFLENLKNPDEVTLPPTEVYLEEIETREKELKSNNGVPKMTTPLIEYIKARKVEQQKIREEKREERKRKEVEKKRIREEERRRRKAEKDKERSKDKIKEKENVSEKETTDDIEESSVSESLKQTEPIVQVLKNPEREKEQKEQVVPPKNSGHYSSKFTGYKDKNKIPYSERERPRYPKDKQRVTEKSGYTYSRDKDRSRKDKSDSKFYVYKRSSGNSEETMKKSKDTASEDVHEDSTIIATEESFSETKDKVQFSPKNKRYNSCPGNVEPSVSRKDDDGFSLHQTGVKSLTCEEALEITDNFKSDSNCIDDGDQSKDPRAERRIRNKDRPSLEIYRPGMRRFSTQRSSPQKEISTSASNSSSPSPTPPLVIGVSKTVPKNGDKTSKKTDERSATTSSKNVCK